MKLKITIEECNDQGVPLAKAPKTSIAVDYEEPRNHHARFHTVIKGMQSLLKHESIRHAAWERSVALESIDPVLDEGEDNVGE